MSIWNGLNCSCKEWNLVNRQMSILISTKTLRHRKMHKPTEFGASARIQKWTSMYNIDVYRSHSLHCFWLFRYNLLKFLNLSTFSVVAASFFLLSPTCDNHKRMNETCASSFRDMCYVSFWILLLLLLLHGKLTVWELTGE